MIRLSGAAWNFRRPQINSVSLSPSIFVLILTAFLNSVRIGAPMRPFDPPTARREHHHAAATGGGLPAAGGALRNAARESIVPWSQYETVPSRAAPLDAPLPTARRTCRFPGFPGVHEAMARWPSSDPPQPDALWSRVGH